jgi:iron complex outermembrane receptor protein
MLDIYRKRLHVWPVIGLALILFIGAPGALAQTGDDEDDEEEEGVYTERVTVTGTRGEGRSAVSSPVPIDVVAPDEISAQGNTDLGTMLRSVVPSFNVNTQPISDAATVVRPANLRNLAPDHTLVLINGKRRHRAAVIYWLGNGVADGAQGPDISTIPAIALRQVEVLRDGASAQYGSDAIAGVMNFLLKTNDSGGTVEFKTGSFYDGDGDAMTLSANIGTGLGENGFANFSIEAGQTDPTSRSAQRPDAIGLIAAGNTAVADPAQIWGQPEIEDDIKLWGNFGKLFGNNKNWYAHMNYASKTVTGGFFFRNPNTRSGVFSGDDGATLLVGDVLDAIDGIPDGSANCPTIPIVGNVPNQTLLNQVLADPNCFTFQELFPGGFTPNFGGEVADYSFVTGMRGQMGNALWDLSVGGGSNEVDFFINNTVNASLGPNTPTDFDPGLYKQDELMFNFDVRVPVSDMVHVAVGAEWREEEFEIGIGQQESFEIGPYALQGFSSASNGFPGFGDIAAGSWDRSNYAVYGDVELSGDNWLAAFAVRFEDFDDFGTTTNGKIAGRYRFNDHYTMRGSVSTGFRAPTPGQSNAFNVSTEFDLVAMELVNNGTIPSSSAIAQLRGGKPLQPEESTNFTAGFIAEHGAFTLTADLFQIDLEDRLGVSQNFTLDPTEVAQLINEGITSAANLNNFRFFVNDFETKTAGIDLVATYAPAARNGQVSLLYNRTDTEVTAFNPDTLDNTRIRELQEALPETRWTLSFMQRATDKCRIVARASFYDDWYDSEDAATYDGKTLFDIEGSYDVSDAVSIVLGGQNIFDTTPDSAATAGAAVGRKYSQYSPFGFNGGFWYARVKYNWGSN